MGWLGSQIGRQILRNELDGEGSSTWQADHTPMQKIINPCEIDQKNDNEQLAARPGERERRKNGIDLI